jgi:F0F1-type ATP synthase membrane subunit b/b'
MERSVQLAKDEALKDLWNKAAELAAALAARVVPRTLTDEDHRKLVEVSLSELNALPAVGSAAEARV